MTEYILMGVMAAAVVLLLILKTNTAVCFLALCAGSVLLSASGDNAGLIAASLTSGNGSSSNIVKVAMLLAPLLVCAVLLRNHIPKSLIPISFIPAVATVLLATILTVPLLPVNLQQTITATETWQILKQYQEPITGIGLIVSIIVLAMSLKKSHNKHKKGH